MNEKKNFIDSDSNSNKEDMVDDFYKNKTYRGNRVVPKESELVECKEDDKIILQSDGEEKKEILIEKKKSQIKNQTENLQNNLNKDVSKNGGIIPEQFVSKGSYCISKQNSNEFITQNKEKIIEVVEKKPLNNVLEMKLVSDILIPNTNLRIENNINKDQNSNQNFSINNVNNIVVYANIDEKKTNKNVHDDIKYYKKSSKINNEENLNQNKGNIKFSNLSNNPKKDLKDKKKTIINKLKNYQVFAEELNDNKNHPEINSTIFPKSSEMTYKRNIIDSLDKMCIAQYNIGQNFPFDPKFLDILCINCYECVKYYEVDKHSEICVIKPQTKNKFVNYQEEDVNAKIYKLYQNLKEKEKEIKKLKDDDLLSILNYLMEYIYEIFLNNNVKNF